MRISIRWVVKMDLFGGATDIGASWSTTDRRGKAINSESRYGFCGSPKKDAIYLVLVIRAFLLWSG